MHTVRWILATLCFKQWRMPSGEDAVINGESHQCGWFPSFKHPLPPNFCSCPLLCNAFKAVFVFLLNLGLLSVERPVHSTLGPELLASLSKTTCQTVLLKCEDSSLRAILEMFSALPFKYLTHYLGYFLPL